MREVTKSKSRRLKSANDADSLYKRSDGPWHARYTARDPETGLGVRKSFYAKTEQDARALLYRSAGGPPQGFAKLSAPAHKFAYVFSGR